MRFWRGILDGLLSEVRKTVSETVSGIKKMVSEAASGTGEIVTETVSGIRKMVSDAVSGSGEMVTETVSEIRDLVKISQVREVATAVGLLTIVASCTEVAEIAVPAGEVVNTTVRFTYEGYGQTKALNPDEYKISDVNLFIFNTYGILEDRVYLSSFNSGQELKRTVTLLKNARYKVYACANFGYALNVNSIEDLKNLRYYIAYPDEYSIGMPMSGVLEDVTITGPELIVPLQRLMAKISIRVDRSALNPDVEFNIKSIKVERCPRSVTPFTANHVSDPFDFFPNSFLRKDYETDVLNIDYRDVPTAEVSLYILENLQGDLLPGNQDETKKVFPETDSRQEFCSYVEISSEYLSDSEYSKNGEFLIYRFYPGESPANFDIRRNTDYKITIMPCGSGLNGTGWRIDKSGIGSFDKVLKLSYSNLALSYVGETRTILPYIVPDYEEKIEYMWDSSDKSVATVTSDGVVTARGEGSCRIICYAKDGSGCTAECIVTVKLSENYMRVSPGNFIRCKLGDVIKVSCDYYPPNAPFDIGLEELEYDKERGIYDYVVEPDGKSVTLYTKARGSGILYMEAGAPISQAEMIVLVVD